MTNFKNENILNLIFSNIRFLKLKTILDETRNKVVIKAALKKLDYDRLVKSIGKTKIVLDSGQRINSCVEFSDNNIISISQNGPLIVWDVNTGISIKTLKEKNYFFSSVLILSDNSICTTSYNSGKIKFWNTEEDFKCVETRSIPGYKSFVNLLLLQNGNIAVSARKKKGPMNSIIIILLNSDIEYLCLEAEYLYPISLVNLSNNRFVSAQASDKYICVWDINNNYQLVKVINSPFQAAYSYKQDNLLMLGYSNISDWDMNNYKFIKEVKVENVYSLVVMCDRYFATNVNRMGIKIWSINLFECVSMIETHALLTMPLVFLKDYRLVCASGRQIIIYNHEYLNSI
jgi:WD40 repeat protein